MIRNWYSCDRERERLLSIIEEQERLEKCLFDAIENDDLERQFYIEKSLKKVLTD